MSSDGGDTDEVTVYGYRPGSIEPYVSDPCDGEAKDLIDQKLVDTTPLSNKAITLLHLKAIINFPMCNVR